MTNCIVSTTRPSYCRYIGTPSGRSAWGQPACVICDDDDAAGVLRRSTWKAHDDPDDTLNGNS
eukprot:6179109-Pleurochrysis_carterae.AAC.6